ncbi:hypothetical protein Rhow_005820 [Rhodococcus wratislaviensis]|uniref:Uncharacterized protein n=2 Tax=Rhodococcus wratislaviensis TaxID=44752 RepID=A0A402BZP7_RHOWR|nr:hypothetical protein Rhow_005820 [Rhodococcus wratislaviensis]
MKEETGMNLADLARYCATTRHQEAIAGGDTAQARSTHRRWLHDPSVSVPGADVNALKTTFRSSR